MNTITQEEINCPECGEFTGLEWEFTHDNKVVALSCNYCHISLVQITPEHFLDIVNGNKSFFGTILDGRCKLKV